MKKILMSLFICLVLVTLVSASSLAVGSIEGSVKVKIDSKLLNEISTREINLKEVEHHQVIISYNGDIPLTEYNERFTSFKGVSAELTYLEIVKIAKDKSTKKIYLDSPIKVDLKYAVPEINAITYKSQGNGINVCILDTGIDKSHFSLNNPLIEYDFINNDSDASDDNGHGTHVAGIISSSNNIYKGVTPNVNLLIGKVIDSEGSGTYSTVISGIEWCVKNNADIISMSLSGSELYTDTCDNDILAQISNWAFEQGVVIVSSAGNKGINGGGSPGCASKTISVGASTNSGKLYSFSSRTSEVDVIAPGRITSLNLGGGFTTKTGTSMSTPMVAGSIALLKSIFPQKSNNQITGAIYSTSKCYSSCVFGEGKGLINVYNACLMLDGKTIKENLISKSIYSRRVVGTIGGKIKKTIKDEFTCVEYKTDNYKTSFSVKGKSEIFFPAKKMNKEYKSTTIPKESNIIFYTKEGYSVEIRGSNGKYSYKVWFDTDVDRAIRNYAYYWKFSYSRYAPVLGETQIIKECILENPNKSQEKSICDEIFKVSYK